MRRTRESGFHALEIVVIIAVVAVVGLVGFKVISGRNNASGDSAATATGTGNSTPEITSPDGLTAAGKTVDTLASDDDLNDITQIEQELNAL